MCNRDWETTVAKCKDQPADVNIRKEAIPDAKVDEEEERKWLTEMERVEANIFGGQRFNKAKTNKEIAAELYNADRADRRIGKNTTVMVDGFAISKESMNCGEWEAVPTFAGKDPRLAEPKRGKKAKVEPQAHCQVCFDGGELHLCQACPRAYHFKCLDAEFQGKAGGWTFNCPQHECHDCLQKTTDAGGMLYRCRWCERAYCEDCMDFDEAVMIGNNLPEYENLGYPEAPQAFYVQCMACTSHFLTSPDDKVLCDGLAVEFEAAHASRLAAIDEAARLDAEEAEADSAEPEAAGVEMSRAGSLTDATTVETPGINTPIVIDDDDDDEDYQIMSSKKRKINLNVGSASKRKKYSFGNSRR
jgi:SWI/SNF-related matrix-associated actin-dependent regulator of chromatin subfamily A member 5